MLNSNLSDNILYLVTFTFILAKHKMATKMLRKPHIFYSLSHIKAGFLIDDFFLVSLEKMTFIRPLNPGHPPFLCIYCYYKYTAGHVDDNMAY